MATTTTKKTTKTVAKKTVAKKTVAKKAVKKVEAKTSEKAVEKTAEKATEKKVTTKAKPAGRYTFATGRRKTAIANVRLFKGDEANQVNKKVITEYFTEKHQQDTTLRPLALTGLTGEYYFTAHVSGGGRTSQVEAVRHGIAQALAIADDELRTVLKKNGFLTRDDRKKERKKPGLRGARRRPQWAKR